MSERATRKPLAQNTAEDLSLLEEARVNFFQDADDFVYGFPCTNDPRDFHPDIEVCTPREIERWAADYRRAQTGIANDDARPYSVYDHDGNEIIHMVPSTWGQGITRFFDDSAVS